MLAYQLFYIQIHASRSEWSTALAWPPLLTDTNEIQAKHLLALSHLKITVFQHAKNNDCNRFPIKALSSFCCFLHTADSYAQTPLELFLQAKNNTTKTGGPQTEITTSPSPSSWLTRASITADDCDATLVFAHANQRYTDDFVISDN